jgi:SAM-dependent methyltransferase
MAMNQKLRFIPSDIEKLYTDQAQEYSNSADDAFDWLYLEKPLLDNVLTSALTRNSKILDAGCGTGRTLKYLLSKKIPKRNIVGVDICNEMLLLANKNAAGVKTLKSDLVKFDTKDRFDVIICIHVFHYLDEIGFEKTLKNFHRLLKEGGTLFFIITHPARTTRYNLSEYFKRDWIVDHTPWGTTSPLFLRPISDIVNETIKAGFVIKSLEEPSVPLRAKRADLVNYLKYACCPSRIAVIAKK